MVKFTSKRTPWESGIPAFEQHPHPQQDCALLSLPPELRNILYHMVCEDVTTVSLSCRYAGKEVKYHYHPLTHTSRQLRNEFLPVWYAHRDLASTILCKIKNFDIGPRDFLRGYLARLSPLPEATTRRYILDVRIDNNFEQGIRGKQVLVEPPPPYDGLPEAAQAVQFEIRVNFDSKSFDVEYLRYFLRRCTFRNDSAMGQALRAAVARYDAEREEVEKARKRRGRGRTAKAKAKGKRQDRAQV